MNRLSRLLISLAFAALIPAHATPFQYDFTGMVVAGSATVPSNTLLSGYFRFDAATAPTSPGVWDLPGAVFHVQYSTLTIDTVGATAHLWPNRDGITFEANVPSGEFPFPNSGGVLDMQFFTFIDNYFSTSQLPTNIPPNDKSLILWADGKLVASTDTNFGVTIHTPEPATKAIVLAVLAGLAWGQRRRLRAKAPA